MNFQKPTSQVLKKMIFPKPGITKQAWLPAFFPLLSANWQEEQTSLLVYNRIKLLV